MSSKGRPPRRAIVWIMIVALAVLVAGLVPYPRAFTAAMRQAESHRVAGEYEAALGAYREAGRLAPSPVPALQRGQIFLQQHRFAEAAAAFVEADRRGAGTTALLGLGEALAGLGDSSAALQAWYRAQSLSPQDPEVYLALARGSMAQARFDQARGYATQVLHLQPDPDQAATAHALLGHLLLAEDRDLAAHHLRQSGDTGMLSVLATAEAKEEGAAREMVLGAAFLRQSDLVLARRHFERAVDLAPADAEPLAYLAHVLDRIGETGQARTLLTQALALDPDSVLAYYFLGIHNRQVGNLPAAQAALWEAFVRDKENAAVRAEMASTFAALSEYEQAEEWYQGAVEVEPDDVEFHLLLTRFYLEHFYRVEEGGLPSAQATVGLAPRDARAHDLLGWALALARQPRDAESHLKEALALDPSLASANYHLGVLYARLGRTEAARRYLQRGADLDTTGQFRRQAGILLAELDEE
jgi:tetratricopeptide (TPR) repeat protein